MPESLLDSQLAAFEMPAADEPARILAADSPIDALIADLISAK
jgi:gluconate kinase